MTFRILLPVCAGVVLASAAGVASLGLAPATVDLPAFAAEPLHGPDGAVHVARHEVTVADWNRCAAAGACALELDIRPGLDPEMTPATGISWLDAQEYLAWISLETGHPLRMPTRAEWDAMAGKRRAKKRKPMPGGSDRRPAASDAPTAALRATGTFPTGRTGIADLKGPVWEWTSDCYYDDMPDDRCPAFWASGQHEAVITVFTRDPANGGCQVGDPPAFMGLRLVSDRPPPKT